MDRVIGVSRRGPSRRGTTFAGASMGIYDREYYRGETRGSGWLTGAAPACKAIILINIASYFLIPFFSDHVQVGWLAATSTGIFHQGRVWELLTATFLHAGPFHLFWNMLFLWMVGREMESFYGTRDFVALYLTAAVASTLGWAAVDAYLHHNAHMLGASGAIMAVGGI